MASGSSVRSLSKCLTSLNGQIQPDGCNGADKTRGVRIHLQSFIRQSHGNNRPGSNSGKQVY